MAGHELRVQRRFGGHGGRHTEWEIHTEIPHIMAFLAAFKAAHATPPEAPWWPAVQIYVTEHWHSLILSRGVRPSTFGAIVAACTTQDAKWLYRSLTRAHGEAEVAERAYAARTARIKAGGCKLDGNKIVFRWTGSDGIEYGVCRACRRASLQRKDII